MNILIVGGGIAGFAMARALELRGFAPDLVERREQGFSAGMGLYMPGNVARALAQLGLLKSVRDIAVPILTQSILDHRGRPLSVSRTQDVWSECGPCLSLPRTALQAILRGSLQQTNARFGVSVTAIQPSAQRCEVVFSDDTTAVYDLVIGADGIKSTVRSLLFPSAVPASVGNVCWRFIAPNTTEINGWTAMLGQGRTLLAIPVSAEKVYVYADKTLGDGEAKEDIQTTPLATVFEDFSAPVLPLIASMPSTTPVHFGSIEQVVMSTWYLDQVVLIGDAAHASSPSMAEGAGMAIEDALVLAETLAASERVDAALQAYVTRRKPRVDWVQQQCVARDTMRSLPPLARNVILRLFGEKLYKRSYGPLLAQV
ncbi:FAD-dependent monooxygenase [Pseudomonas sp. EL_65y_Pfl2_R95]|uniref:FAD-dependent monooxygenase n=1 Tax=Pseudomonas sp. EL_65y_Pfl2_R95 TaxID=3088698 RepID=UPI0030D9451C